MTTNAKRKSPVQDMNSWPLYLPNSSSLYGTTGGNRRPRQCANQLHQLGHDIFETQEWHFGIQTLHKENQTVNVVLLPLLSKLIESSAGPSQDALGTNLHLFHQHESRTPRRSDAEFQSSSDRMAWELESRQISPECNATFEMIVDLIQRIKQATYESVQHIP